MNRNVSGSLKNRLPERGGIMHEHSSEFDPATFDPQNSPEELCWAALPELTGSIRAWTLYHLGSLSCAREDFLRSSTLAEAAADAFKETGIFPMAAEALMSSSRSFANLKDIPEAIERCRQAIATFIEVGESAKAIDASSFLGALLIEAAEFQQAHDVLSDALNMVDSEGGIANQVVLEALHNYQGETFLNLGKYRDACNNFKIARDLGIANDRAEIAAQLQHRAGVCLYKLGDFTTATTYFLASYNVGVLNKDTELVALCGMYLIMCYRTVGDHDSAMRRVEMVFPYIQDSTDLITKSYFDREVAELHIAQQDYQAAYEAAERSYSGFTYTDEYQAMFQIGIVAAIALTRLERLTEATSYISRLRVLAASHPEHVIDEFDRELMRLVQLWIWATDVERHVGWTSQEHYEMYLFGIQTVPSEAYPNLMAFTEVTVENLDSAPAQVCDMLVMRTELLYSQCEASSTSVETQKFIAHILEVFEKCADELGSAQKARLFHLLGRARGFRYEAYRSFAQALALYIELEDTPKVLELIEEMKALFELRTEEEIEKAWNRPKSQKAKAVKTSLEG